MSAPRPTLPGFGAEVALTSSATRPVWRAAAAAERSGFRLAARVPPGGITDRAPIPPDPGCTASQPYLTTVRVCEVPRIECTDFGGGVYECVANYDRCLLYGEQQWCLNRREVFLASMGVVFGRHGRVPLSP